MEKEINLVNETISIAGKNFVLERVKNIDDLVDKISDDLFNQDERLPYWAELWPAAIALSRYILKNSDNFAGKNILELGCGMGLTTMAVQTVGPASLMATDYEQEALQSTQKNFELNNLKVPELKLLDWREPQLKQKFEVIIASDVAYEQRFFQPLIDLFKQFLQKDGSIFLAEPNRSVARTFFGKLALEGFIFDSNDIRVDQNGHKITVSIYKIYFGREDQ